MSDAERPILRPVTDETSAIRVKPRLKWLRLIGLLVPLGVLAVVSTVFGMMMAVASDLPALENEPQYQGNGGQNSVLLDVHGNTLGRLASDQHRIFVQYDDISSNMRAAIIAIEDRRFYTNSGVDIRGIARAFGEDLVKGGAVQGGSTITQQFVKNALQAQDKRTVFQKLREAALAYHLTRKWSKQKILTEYLNSIYFGNGAYGIESAAETYFGQDVNHAATPDRPGCGTIRRPCAKELAPQEAALLAAIVASPSRFDPVAHPRAALARRNLVLQKMRDQGALKPLEYSKALAEGLPAPENVKPPSLNTKAPYFVSWVRQQLVDKYGARRAFEGGFKVRTTIDMKLQDFAQNAVNRWVGGNPNGPTAALVAIDNDSGEVRAMVSGTQSYSDRPFNLATQGQRQPGSSFKPFILAQALRKGISPNSIWESKKKIFCVSRFKDGRCKEEFPVNNDEGVFVGQRSLANALTFSDNSVFATVGIQVGTEKIAKLAERMGIRTPVSHNLAMTLGGLQEGVTPLDMAHAYETFATGGQRISGSLGAGDDGPVGIRYIEDDKGHKIENKPRMRRVLPKNVAQTTSQVMTTVVSQGTAKRAQIGQFAAGKTGTTSNYGDAWFVGFTGKLTVAVWVGYPDKLVPMKTDFEGGPVEGGTFPALIWHDFMLPSMGYLDEQAAKERAKRAGKDGDQPRTTTNPAGQVVTEGGTDTGQTTAPDPAATGDGTADGTGTGTGDGTTGGDTGGTGGGTATPATGQGTATPKKAAPATPAPTPTPTPTPAPVTPAPTPPAGGGTGGADPTGGAGPPTG